MIKRIELTNFMSHEHTVIEPAAGLTVLVGPNNCGKSAVVAALQILCHNDSSTYVLRHGEKECSVKVETDDGHTVEWRRKNSPSWAAPLCSPHRRIRRSWKAFPIPIPERITWCDSLPRNSPPCARLPASPILLIS